MVNNFLLKKIKDDKINKIALILITKFPAIKLKGNNASNKLK